MKIKNVLFTFAFCVASLSYANINDDSGLSHANILDGYESIYFSADKCANIEKVYTNDKTTLIVFNRNFSDKTAPTLLQDNDNNILNVRYFDDYPYIIKIDSLSDNFWIRNVNGDKCKLIIKDNQFRIPKQTIVPIDNFVYNKESNTYSATISELVKGYVGKYFPLNSQIVGSCVNKKVSGITITNISDQKLNTQNTKIILQNNSFVKTDCKSNNGTPTRIIVDSEFYK